MKPTQQIIAQALTYAGTTPLVGAALGLVFSLLTRTDAVHIATTYSAIIIAFLSGIHWACHLFFTARCPRNLLCRSNAVALLAWLSLLAQSEHWTLLLQILCFLYLLTLDLTLRDVDILPAWFYNLRRNATIVVVLSLTLVMSFV